jgi:hypothetical protein
LERSATRNRAPFGIFAIMASTDPGDSKHSQRLPRWVATVWWFLLTHRAAVAFGGPSREVVCRPMVCSTPAPVPAG